MSIRLIYIGLARRKEIAYAKAVIESVLGGVSYSRASLERIIDVVQRTDNDQILGSDSPEQLERAHELIHGLHSLLPPHPLYSYSCLVVVSDPKPSHFRVSLDSVMKQSAPSFEVIVGFNGSPKTAVRQVFVELQQKYAGKLFSVETPLGPETRLFNLLAQKASSNILVFFTQDGRMRFDLLFRFEQMFRMFPDPETTVIYSKETDAAHHGRTFHFPYVFDASVPNCIAISKSIWNQIGGFREELHGAHFYDLLLRLDLAGVNMHETPTSLYSIRNSKAALEEKAVKAFADYVQQKQLDWTIEKGEVPYTLRAIPKDKQGISIHVIVPFKDQKEVTLLAINSLKRQKGLDLRITAVDNWSSDLSIGKELQSMRVEVLRIDEPFNFSRLNNLAITHTKVGTNSSLLFFMNNDVELSRDDSLLEMTRWIDQPGIGMVGCCLYYPNGLLQHGGMHLDKTAPAYKTSWSHTEHQLPYHDLRLARTLRVVDCVTGAAILMRRDLFQKVGGFDEIWHPNSGSDTNLAEKLKTIGLSCFYTPFASAIHHESLSRINGAFFEEYENLTILQDYYRTYLQ